MGTFDGTCSFISPICLDSLHRDPTELDRTTDVIRLAGRTDTIAISVKIHSPDYSRSADLLRACSEFHVSAHSKSPSWHSAYVFIQSAKGLDEYAQQDLQGALATSDAELSPLRDPLALNLGAHRWLSGDREESYSDWLAWILQGMLRAGDILLLFGFDVEGTSDVLGQVENVYRERSSEHGRTDIEVRFGNRGLLLIEVKVQDPGSELPSQLERYSRRAAEEHVRRKLLALLGTEAPASSIAPFEFTDWRTLCQRLRRYANDVKKSDLLRAAAILIFCGAVEQNVLGLSVPAKRLHALPTVDYLRRWRDEP